MIKGIGGNGNNRVNPHEIESKESPTKKRKVREMTRQLLRDLKKQPPHYCSESYRARITGPISRKDS